VFAGLLEQCRATAERIEALEAEIVAHARGDDTARRLATVPGIGPITASLIAATVGGNIGAFRSARHFAAWLGLVPRQHSTGGKTRLGRITKAGDREIRTLLVLGATSMVHRAARWNSAAGAWDPRAAGAASRPAGDGGAGEQDGAHRLGADGAQGGLPGDRTRRGRFGSRGLTVRRAR
jgi:transposase